MTLALWELAKNRDIQERLRTEVMESLGKIKARGDSDFTTNDFDSMPYLIAVGKVRLKPTPKTTGLIHMLRFAKEILRVHAPVIDMQRIPNKDTVLPLSRPVVGVSGKVYNELPVPAGTYMSISVTGYNLYVPVPLPQPRRRNRDWLTTSQEQGRMGTRRLRIPAGAVAGDAGKARIILRGLW